MATKKPVFRVPEARAAEDVPKTLMDNQDLRKGDSTGSLRRKDKCITFWVTAEQKEQISAYATEHHMTVSRLIIEGLDLRMKQD